MLILIGVGGEENISNLSRIFFPFELRIIAYNQNYTLEDLI